MPLAWKINYKEGVKMWEINAMYKNKWLGNRLFQGYSKREAVKRYREAFGVVGKHITLHIHWAV